MSQITNPCSSKQAATVPSTPTSPSTPPTRGAFSLCGSRGQLRLASNSLRADHLKALVDSLRKGRIYLPASQWPKSSARPAKSGQQWNEEKSYYQNLHLNQLAPDDDPPTKNHSQTS